MAPSPEGEEVTMLSGMREDSPWYMVAAQWLKIPPVVT